MSLNWDTTAIEGYMDSIYAKSENHAITDCIVHRMMHTGLGWELSKENAAEFYARCKLADSLGGVLLFISGKPSEITPKMIQDHIGLHVNVAPETRKGFANRYIRISFDKWLIAYSKATSLSDTDHELTKEIDAVREVE